MSRKPIAVEIEIEIDDTFYVIDLENNHVSISEVMPGMVLPVEELAWVNWRLQRGSELSASAYETIEAKLNAEVQRRYT